MGLFNWLQKAKKKETSIPSEGETVVHHEELEVIQPQRIDGVTSIADMCEQMVLMNRQIEDMKEEYQTVTSYLTDIQKIDRIPEDKRDTIEVAARNILAFSKEREKYRNKDSKLSDSQRKLLERLEGNLILDLKNMKKNEEYNSVIKGDLRHLEGEKGVLTYEKEEIQQKQQSLSKIAAFLAVLVVSIFALLAVIAYAFSIGMEIPYLMTIIMALVFAMYIYFESSRNRQQLKLIDKKINRAIGLLNKVKIKYINNRSLLDYLHDKYEVSSFAELDYLWKQYVIEKELEKNFIKHTEKLNQAKEMLLEELASYALFDPTIWAKQAQAILDKKEMVEVRHELNVRRQKLRDNLDYNKKNYTQNKQAILNYMEQNPSMQEEVKEILRNYGLDS